MGFLAQGAQPGHTSYLKLNWLATLLLSGPPWWAGALAVDGITSSTVLAVTRHGTARTTLVTRTGELAVSRRVPALKSEGGFRAKLRRVSESHL